MEREKVPVTQDESRGPFGIPNVLIIIIINLIANMANLGLRETMIMNIEDPEDPKIRNTLGNNIIIKSNIKFVSAAINQYSM